MKKNKTGIFVFFLIISAALLLAGCGVQNGDPNDTSVPNTEGETLHSSDLFADPSELIWTLQQRFGMDAMDDTNVMEVCDENVSVLFAVHKDSDGGYTVFARQYQLEDMFWGDMGAYEGKAVTVADAPEYWNGAKKLTVPMQGGMECSVWGSDGYRNVSESPTLHYPPSPEITRQWTVILDSENRILELHGIRDDVCFFVDDAVFTYAGNRIIKVDCPGAETVGLRYERSEDHTYLYKIYNDQEEKTLSMTYENGKKAILYDESGDRILADYSDAVYDDYGKTERLSIGENEDDRVELTIIYNDLGPVMTYDGYWRYTERGYADRSDESAFYTYSSSGDEFTVSLHSPDGTVVGYNVYSPQGKLLQAFYLSATTGKMVPYKIDDPAKWGDWIFTD